MTWPAPNDFPFVYSMAGNVVVAIIFVAVGSFVVTVTAIGYQAVQQSSSLRHTRMRDSELCDGASVQAFATSCTLLIDWLFLLSSIKFQYLFKLLSVLASRVWAD